MNLLHYCDKPFNFDRKCEYRNAGAYKPFGFWVSVEGPDDWEEWCKTEEYNLDSLRHVYKVTISENANILHISTSQGMDDFNRRFAIKKSYFTEIAWENVYQEYDVLIISPYRWKHRLNQDFSWYYGWDCASGVIWNLEAIKNIVETGPCKSKARIRVPGCHIPAYPPNEN